MAKWVVKSNLKFGNQSDMELHKTLEKVSIDNNQVFAIPADSSSVDAIFGINSVIQVQFNNQNSCDAYYGKMQTTIAPSNMLPIGVMPVGVKIGNPDTITGAISRHLCRHDNPENEWYDCKNDPLAQYSEVIK